MKKTIGFVIAASLLASAAHSQATIGYEHAGPPGVTMQPGFRGDITNIPGKSLSVETVTYAPGAVSGSHRHAKSAYIYAYVLEGAIRSQVEGEPARIFHAGESWVEAPGAHHVVGEDTSKTAPAKLLAVFVVDTTDTALTTPDR